MGIRDSGSLGTGDDILDQICILRCNLDSASGIYYTFDNFAMKK